ncbi:MAG: hypothetical protein LBK97_00135 [Prevotellaceae bacterium]|nr:hypothetical protein [Prevotellaceae bacterium]
MKGVAELDDKRYAGNSHDYTGVEKSKLHSPVRMHQALWQRMVNVEPLTSKAALSG